MLVASSEITLTCVLCAHSSRAGPALRPLGKMLCANVLEHLQNQLYLRDCFFALNCFKLLSLTPEEGEIHVLEDFSVGYRRVGRTNAEEPGGISSCP